MPIEFITWQKIDYLCYIIKHKKSWEAKVYWNALQERVFERLFKAAEIAGFSKRELYEYEDSLKVFRDWYSVVKTAEKKGHVKGYKEGEKKGFKEGEKKKQQEIARNLKTMGLSPDAIIKATGLSSGEIEDI